MDPSQEGKGDLNVFRDCACVPVVVCNSHVLRDGSVADSVCSCRDAGLAAVTAPAAVEAWHVHSVQVIMILSASMSHGLLLAVFFRPARTNTQHTNDC